MNWANLLRRWTLRTIHAAVLGSALLGSASALFAQPAGNLPRQNFTRSHTFDLPIEMKDADRMQLSELKLYVKTPTTGWKLQESKPPHITRFTCKVTQDGEYWYSLVTVDRQGRAQPADVNLEPPSQRVVVDTTGPVLQVQPAASPTGDFFLRCTVEDANADPASLKAICKSEFGDIPLEQAANQHGVFIVKGPEPLRYPVVVTAKDQAGNITSKEVNVREMIGSMLQPGNNTIEKTQAQKQLPDKLPNDVSQASVRPEQPKDPLPPSRFELPPTKQEGPPHRVELPPPLKGQEPVKTFDITPKIPTPVTDPSKSLMPYQLINTTRASVEYRIDQVGASGVGRVEIYLTPDNGQTWHRMGEDPDKASPANIVLPGDGVYGIRICVTNGNGFGGKAPVRGDAPHCMIEVDSTSPFIQLRSAEVIPSSGEIELRWNATDKNLGREPITISYRTKADGVWQKIANNVKNEGMYRWSIPRDVGGQVFFKIEVTDQAGNASHDSTRQAVVIDMSEPRATVVGVSGNQQR